jgi:hypothetical protein
MILKILFSPHRQTVLRTPCDENGINYSNVLNQININKVRSFVLIILEIKSFIPVVSSINSDLTKPYDFGIGEMTGTHSVTSRSSNKRVHWIDDDEMILNASHRFIEYLKLFVRNQIEDSHPNDDYLKQCQIFLNELDSLIDCQKIKTAFDDMIQLTKTSDKNRLHIQQIYIENLISHTILLSSA